MHSAASKRFGSTILLRSHFTHQVCVYLFVQLLPLRRYRIISCLRIIHTNRSHILQSDTAELMNMWIAALHKSIDAAIQYNRYDHLKFDSDSMLGDTLPGAAHTKKV